MPVSLKTQAERTAKTPIQARRACDGSLCGFRSAAERRARRKPEDRTLRRRAAQKFDRSPAQRVRSKEEMQRNGRDLPLAAGRGMWSLHRRGGEAAGYGFVKG